MERGSKVIVKDNIGKTIEAVYDGLDTVLKGLRVHRVHIFKKGEKVATRVKAARSSRSKSRVKTLKNEGWRTWYLPESRFISDLK